MAAAPEPGSNWPSDASSVDTSMTEPEGTVSTGGMAELKRAWV
jgi:hypothetical protein